MAELSPKERLQPSLLDRLTDFEPGARLESSEARFATMANLRDWVRRDLSWLLNTTQLASVQDLSATPNAARSTLNYGVPGMAGHTLSSVDQMDLEASLREAIIAFEPRLTPSSLSVRVSRSDVGKLRNAIVFHIEAELWAQPLPLALALRTELDLENGSVTVEEVQHPEGR